MPSSKLKDNGHMGDPLLRPLTLKEPSLLAPKVRVNPLPEIYTADTRIFFYSTTIARQQMLMVFLKEFTFSYTYLLNWLGETINCGDYVFFRLNIGQVWAIHDFQVKNYDKLGNIWIHGQHISRCTNSFEQTDNSNLKAKLTIRAGFFA